MKILITSLLILMFLIPCHSQLLEEGSLVRAEDNDTIYLVFNRELHHVPNVVVFSKLFIPNALVSVRKKMELQTLPIGTPLRDSRLIKDDSPAIYLTYDTYKVHIGNTFTFDTFKFNWGEIQNVDPEEIKKLTTLHPLELIPPVVNKSDFQMCGND